MGQPRHDVPQRTVPLTTATCRSEQSAVQLASAARSSDNKRLNNPEAPMTHPYRTSDRPTTAARPAAIARLDLPDSTPASFLAALIDEYRAVAQDRGVALRLAVSTSLPA